MSSSNPDQRQISRTEWVWLLGALLAGIVLRLGFPGRVAVEHFDEGVYASNLWFEPANEYPARHLYAPPLLPFAIEWTMIAASLCGASPAGIIPVLPSLIAGLATIPSAWWIGRRWFGPSAGIVAAWLIATSNFHASYSRAALTDVPVCLFILWAVYFGERGLKSGAARDLIATGVFTGIAWWTKYSGWLPLAIILTGGLAWRLVMTVSGSKERATEPVSNLGHVVRRGMTQVVIAFFVWSPVLFALQKHGGYAAVTANHRQYAHGVNGWIPAAVRQLTNTGRYDNWFAFVLEAFESTSVSAGLSQALMVATPLVFLVVAGLGCGWWIASHRSVPESLPGWMLAAWIGGLSVSIPFYHSYPRLMLPWLIAVWMGTGLATEWLGEASRPRTGPVDGTRSTWFPDRWVIALVVWLSVSSAVRCGLGTEHAWQNRTDLATEISKAAAMIKAATSDSGFPRDEAIVYVLGEPAVVFALKANGLGAVGPVQDLDFLTAPRIRPTFFVHAERAHRSSSFQREWADRQSQFETVSNPTIRLSHLVALDEELDFVELDRRIHSGERFWISRVR